MKRSLVYYFSSLFLLFFLFESCKTAQKTTKTTQEVVEVVKAVEEKLTIPSIDRTKAPEAGPAKSVQLGDYESFTLENGLKVFLVENHQLPKVSFQLTVDHPPFKEGKVAGAMNIMGDLLRMGTTTRNKQTIDEAVDFVGASLGTGSNGVYGGCLTKHTETLLGLMSDVLLNPTFPEEELQKIKKQTLSSLAQAKEDPGTISSNVRRVLLYGKDHPYGELTTEETIQAITKADCQAAYDTWFKPNISYLVIVGDIDKGQAKIMAERYFSDWKPGEVPEKELPAITFPEKTQVTFVEKAEATQSNITVAYPIEMYPGRVENVKASVMNEILGGGNFNARLFQNLREDKAYTYGAYSSLRSNENVGRFTISTKVRNEVTDSALVQIMYEMNRMLEEQVSPDEVQLVKNSLNGDFARSLERPQTIASFALNTARYGLAEDYYHTYLQRLEAVSVEDISGIAKQYIQPDKAHILIVGNQEVADKLARFSADGQLRIMDHLGNLKE